MSKTGSSVWYAAYGSNLLSSRFMAYINGGDLAGSRRGHRGARDRTPPSDWLTYTFDPRYYLCFAGESTRWTGGVCFLGSEESAAEQQARRPVLGRAWLINESQLVDVWSQESMSDANDLERAMAEGAFDPSVAGAQIRCRHEVVQPASRSSAPSKVLPLLPSRRPRSLT